MSRLQTAYAPPASRPRQPQTSGGWTALMWVLLTLPILLFGWFWQRYAVNVPKWDDHALRHFLLYFDQETTLSGRMYQLFKQHNEHRIVYDRIVTLLDYRLFGKLSYRHLMLIGNLSLVGLLAVFTTVLRRQNRPVIYAVPVALLLFNLSQWENMFWGMAALQNFSVVLWVLAALYFLTYTNRWGLALVMAVLATLTSGNGLLVWPIGLVLIALRLSESGLRMRSIMGWATGAVVVISLYFTGFEKPGGIVYVRPGAFDLLKGWFAVVGAAAEALPVGSPLRNSTLLGGLMTLTTLGIASWNLLVNESVIRRAFVNRPAPNAQRTFAIPSVTLFFWGCAGFILGTAAVVAWARTGFGADLLITSRYKMYSLTLLALLYMYAIVALPQGIGRWAGTLGGLGSLALAWLSYYSFFDETIWWRHWLLTNQFNWTYTTTLPVAKLDPTTERYTDQAPAFYNSVLPTIFGPAQPAPMPVSVTKTPAGYAVQNTALPAPIEPDAGAYLLVRSPKRIYLFPAWPNQASLLRAGWLLARPFTTGFRGTISPAELDAGQYELFVLTIADAGQGHLYPTHQTLSSAGQAVDTTKKNW